MKKTINIFLVFVFSLSLVKFVKGSVNPWNKNYQAAATKILEDFQVNENVGESSQIEPVVAMDDRGNFVVVWSDDRNGDTDIFGQRYNSNGSLAGSQFRVNDDPGHRSQSKPQIAMSRDGNYWIIWLDYQNGYSVIYGQRYDIYGTPIGANFIINSDSKSLKGLNPVIAVDENNSFLIVWIDKTRNNKWYIVGQRYSENGTLQGSKFLVTDQGDGRDLAVAMDSTGNFVIAWSETRYIYPNIYAQCFNPDATSRSSVFRVDWSSYCARPKIAIDNQENICIIWTICSFMGESIISGKCYNHDGSPKGSEFNIHSSNWSERSYKAIDTNYRGNFLIVWENQDNYDYYPNITGRWFNADGMPIGDGFQVNDDSSNFRHLLPDVAVNKNGNFVAAWQDERNGLDNTDIFGQRFNSDCSPVGSNYKINNDKNSGIRTNPNIAANSQGNFMVIWQDLRNGNSDIFSQFYSSTGEPGGVNKIVNDDSGTKSQAYPVIAADSCGNFMAVWRDYRNMDSYIYGQFFKSDGTIIGNNFRINTDYKEWRPIEIDGSSDYFVVVWRFDKTIWSQCYSNSGTPLGDNFKVSEDFNNCCASPKVAVDGNSFVIVWEDSRNRNSDIYGQRYLHDGTPQGANFKINEISNGLQNLPDVAMLDNGGFVVVWSDQDQKSDLFGRLFSADGTPQASIQNINDWAGKFTQSLAVTSDTNGNFVVTWQDERKQNADVYGQLFEKDGKKIGINYRINNDQTQKYQGSPAAAMSNNYIYYSWIDNRVPGQGYDIFARVDLFNTASIFPETNNSGMARDFFLEQNYPNPFNPTTTIQFQLQKSAFIELNLYNVTGQRVKILYSGYKNSGIFTNELNGHDLASGLYFYELKIKGHSELKKCLLLK